MAVKKDSSVAGHAPRELSRMFSFFLRHDGNISTAVAGPRKF